LPDVINLLEKLEAGNVELSEGGGGGRVCKAVNQLLTYTPLLDIVDAKCRLVC